MAHPKRRGDPINLTLPLWEGFMERVSLVKVDNSFAIIQQNLKRIRYGKDR
jgi:hypothetical protein